MNRKIDLSIIIVSWNVKDYLKNCLFSIFAHLGSGFNYEVIVVDNASSDGTVQELGPKFTKILFIANNENVGFGRANNQGFKKSKGEIILFLNPDTIIKDRAIQKLLRFVKKTPNIGIVGPRVLWPSGLIQWSWTGCLDKEPRLAGKGGQPLICLLERALGTKKFRVSRPIRVLGVHGVAMMVKKKVFQEVGGFDEDIFINLEAADLCLRVKERGYDNYFLPMAEIIHFGGRSKAQQPMFFDLFHNLKSGTKLAIKGLKKLTALRWN